MSTTAPHREVTANALASVDELQHLVLLGQRIALLGTVHGERDDGVVTRLEQKAGHAVS